MSAAEILDGLFNALQAIISVVSLFFASFDRYHDVSLSRKSVIIRHGFGRANILNMVCYCIS